MREEQYWVQINGGLEYTTNDSGRLWAMLFGLMIGAGQIGGVVYETVNSMVDSVVKEQEESVKTLADGRVLRVSVVLPGVVHE